MKLTLDIIKYIIDNCKDNGEVGYYNNEEDISAWHIYFISDEIFKAYEIIHNVCNNEDRDYWSIDCYEGSTMENDYYNAIDNDVDDYKLDDFYKEYGKNIETNKEVINLVTKYVNYTYDVK